MRLRAVFVAALLAGVARAAAASGAAGVNPRLAGIPVDERRDPAVGRSYRRSDWQHWVDEDDDCQNTRAEVLVREGTQVEYTSDKRCHVAAGVWFDPYTGKTFTDPADLDIDHMVPLKDAFVSGGYRWSAAKKRAYANDLSDPHHLIAVEDDVNEAKSDHSPDEWMPPLAVYACTYLDDWARIKARWGLAMTRAEFDYVNARLNACDAAGRSAGAVTPAAAVPARSAPAAAPEPVVGACCRICRDSQACGDACITPGRACKQPKGCACEE